MDEIERVARAMCEASGNDPDALTYAIPDGPKDFPAWRDHEPEARAAIEAVNCWRTMDSAPKDGTKILAVGRAYKELVDDGFTWGMADPNKPMVDGYVTIVRWVEAWYDEEVDLGNGTYRKERKQGYAYWKPHAHAFVPTHWMPLPSPPDRPL